MATVEGRMVGLLGVMVIAADISVHTTGPGESADQPCEPLVQQQLRAWTVVGPARSQPGVTGTGIVRHWPTTQLGVWVVEAVVNDAAQLTRVDASALTRIEWSAACAPTTTSRARPTQAGPRFSDSDLVALLQPRSRGVIYLWSPHMPLSLDAYRSLIEAARDRALTVTPLLDPTADRNMARAALERAGLPAVALQVADSVELTFRDVLVHAPSIQAYADGHLVGSPYPGAHTASEYGAFLDRVLALRTSR